MRRDRGVFPGDHLCAIGDLAQVLLGPGVARDGDFLVASRAGVLRWEAERSRLWVDNDQKRYVPALGDHVIGVVVEKHAEEYRLRVGAAALATLPTLAFDGATKRNRPHLEVGTLVYARVVLANKDMEPEVSCAAPPGVGAKDWVTKESVFGELEGGNVFDCPQALCRELLATDSAVLDALGGGRAVRARDRRQRPGLDRGDRRPPRHPGAACRPAVASRARRRGGRAGRSPQEAARRGRRRLRRHAQSAAYINNFFVKRSTSELSPCAPPLTPARHARTASRRREK